MTYDEFQRVAAENGWVLQSGAWQRGKVRIEILVEDGLVIDALLFHGRDVAGRLEPRHLSGLMA